MYDQANALRGLMERRAELPSASTEPSRTPHWITITSGKGGVGKSHLALNLGITLAEVGSVLLIDCNWGTGNLELLSGLKNPGHFSQVLEGTKSLGQIAGDGPRGIRIVTGVDHLADPNIDPARKKETLKELRQFATQFDFVITDLAVGLGRWLPEFFESADRVFMVTSPEPASIADSYAALKSFAGNCSGDWEIVITQTESLTQADAIFAKFEQTAQFFLKTQVNFAGAIPSDQRVTEAALNRAPFLLEYPNANSSRAIKQIGRRILNQTQTPTRKANPKPLDGPGVSTNQTLATV